MNLETYTFTPSQLENFGNQVKDTVVRHLQNAGLLDVETAENLMLTRQIVVKPPGVLSRLYYKILGQKEAEKPPRIIIAQHDRMETLKYADSDPDDELLS